jgi:hypothetical protein
MTTTSQISEDEVKRRIAEYSAIHGTPKTPIEHRGFEVPSGQKIRRQKVRDPSKYSIGSKIAMLIDFSELMFEPDDASGEMRTSRDQDREYWTVLAKINDRAMKSPILQGQGTVYELQHLDNQQWQYHEDGTGQWVEYDVGQSNQNGINSVFSHDSKDCPTSCPFDSKQKRPLRYWLTVDEDGKRASLIFTSSVVDFQQLHDDLTDDVNLGIIFAEYPVIATETFEVSTTLVRSSKPRIKFNQG